MSTGGQLPDELREVDHRLDLIEADFEGIGHWTKPGRIDDDIPVFDRCPLGGRHAGQLSRLLDGAAGGLACLLDQRAEQLAPGLALEGGEGIGGGQNSVREAPPNPLTNMNM